MSRLESEVAHTWRVCVQEHKRLKNLTWKEAAVLTWIGCLVDAGQCEPSEATLAGLADVHVRTVRRAKLLASSLGILAWDRVYEMVNGRNRERPCRYRVVVPEVVVQTPRPAPVGQRSRPIQVSKQDRGPTHNRDLLAERRAAFQLPYKFHKCSLGVPNGPLGLLPTTRPPTPLAGWDCPRSADPGAPRISWSPRLESSPAARRFSVSTDARNAASCLALRGPMRLGPPAEPLRLVTVVTQKCVVNCGPWPFRAGAPPLPS